LNPREGKRTGRSWFGLAVLLGLLGALSGCASSQGDLTSLSSSSDEIVWQAAEKALQKRQWDTARKHYRRIIDGFPQSDHLPDARLNLAETHFKEGGTGNLVLAVSEYREFLTLYPSHPKSDYAQFQTAESYYLQRNGPDRDQTNTTKALDEYERLLDVYPNSSHVEVARLRVANLRQYLAKAEFSAGYFYQRTRKAYRSAVNRYEGILSDYPDYAAIDEVLYRLSESLVASARKAEALPYLSRLTAEYTSSKFAPMGRTLMDELARQGVAAPPPGPAVPASVPTPTPPAEKPAP
jgi:outer membrane protein assembly factor BamD